MPPLASLSSFNVSKEKACFNGNAHKMITSAFQALTKLYPFHLVFKHAGINLKHSI
ncbi:hypothetical protein CHCC20347_2587 [Bacillus paralicheniformis]|nr:hypothetical protein CHCC20347_2587 [Bacillus paralicheniformis]